MSDSSVALGPLGLFAGFGVELEYMIVDRDTLDVRPVADELFRAAAGFDTSDVEPDGPGGVIGYSNELALHVAELKTIAPVATLDGLAALFQEHVARIDAHLAPLGARLMPTGMHPWMDPDAETRLWPHESNAIYRTFDRIFGCRGHGWSNLQSTHINLPFCDAGEFGRLHAAIRLVLPLIPAIAASTPIANGRLASHVDYRMEVYRTNSVRVPMMTGGVVPEPVFTPADYQRVILGRLYAELAPLDPDRVLRHEWANARGCIARFDRGSIEIRVMDVQECPAADLAIVALIVEVVRALVDETWIPYREQKRIATEPLYRLLLDTTRWAENARVDDAALLAVYGCDDGVDNAGGVWRRLLERVLPSHPEHSDRLRRLIDNGSLATRILRLVGPRPTHEALERVYRELADCLARGSELGAR